MADRLIKGEHRTNPYLVPVQLSGQSVGTWQEDYLLREVEYVHLKNGKPKTVIWAGDLLLTTFGYALGLIAKGYSNISTINTGEWIALAAGGIISICLYAIGYFLPNERKDVMKRIEDHFKQAPTSRQAFPKIKK